MYFLLIRSLWNCFRPVTRKELKVFLCTTWRHKGKWRYGSTHISRPHKWCWAVRVTPRSVHPPRNRAPCPLNSRLIGPHMLPGLLARGRLSSREIWTASPRLYNPQPTHNAASIRATLSNLACLKEFLIFKFATLYSFQSECDFQICKLIFFLSEIRGLPCRSQWPRGLRPRSAAARLLRLWVRIPPGAWMFVCCECCVLSGRGLCYEPITRPEESYRLWCVVVCDL